MSPEKLCPSDTNPARLVWLVCLVVCLVSSARSQHATVPTIAFTCDFPNSDPSHYAVSVSSDGHGSYISDGKLAPSSDPAQPSSLNFTVSSTLAARMFDLAQQAHYFEGQIDSRKKNIAFTGDKSLSYKAAQRSTLGSYNYSTIPAVQELTTIFQSLSTTLEFGRRLEYDCRYQKLALDEELRRMEGMASQGESEMGVVAPILQKILGDSSVINEVRARAQRLLERAGTGNK